VDEPQEVSRARWGLKALLSPDFIGSVAVTAALIAVLVAVVVSSGPGELFKKGGLVMVGVLVAAITAMLKVMVLPLWREARAAVTR
jgi:hypothetical protein